MRIIMFSVNSLFPDTVMGGAPKHLQNIATHLGKLGHDVTILCTKVPGNEIPFQWHDRVLVKPVLPLNPTLPQPYEVPAYSLAAVLYEIGEHLEHADRFYLHDGEFLLPYAYRHVPTAVSLRDNVYPETILGSFLFQSDRLILISEYSRRYYTHTVGRFFPELQSRIQVILNGLDWSRFKPTQADDILKIIPIDLEDGPIVLHPHRPEFTKGIHQTIAVADLLVHQHGVSNLKVLAPRWMDEQLTPELRDFYASIMQEINGRGLSDNFIFHDWIPQPLMPEYYSLGTVTLSLGSFPESFGNAVYESLGCGTPTIAARIATHRELLPDDLLDKVDYGNVEEAAAKAARIIGGRERTRSETLDYLYEHYSVERQLNQYADVILNARQRSEMVYRHPKIGADTRFVLAPWCYMAKRGIYHDFRAEYTDLGHAGSLLARYPEGFVLQVAEANGVTRSEVDQLCRDGYLVPLSQD